MRAGIASCCVWKEIPSVCRHAEHWSARRPLILLHIKTDLKDRHGGDHSFLHSFLLFINIKEEPSSGLQDPILDSDTALSKSRMRPACLFACIAGDCPSCEEETTCSSFQQAALPGYQKGLYARNRQTHLVQSLVLLRASVVLVG